MDSFTTNIASELLDGPKVPNEILSYPATSLQGSKESESTVLLDNEGSGPWWQDAYAYCTIAWQVRICLNTYVDDQNHNSNWHVLNQSFLPASTIKYTLLSDFGSGSSLVPHYHFSTRFSSFFFWICNLITRAQASIWYFDSSLYTSYLFTFLFPVFCQPCTILWIIIIYTVDDIMNFLSLPQTTERDSIWLPMVVLIRNVSKL